MNEIKELLKRALFLIETEIMKKDSSSGNQQVLTKPSARPEIKRKGFPAVCSVCGTDCFLPFTPLNDNPVYCKSCYKDKMGY